MLLKVLRSAVRGKANYIFEGNTKLNNTPALKKSRKMANADATQPAKRQQDVNSKPTLRKEKLRQANKNKSTPYIPGTVTLQVLGSGSNGAPASVYLFTDQSRYLFNCGEGTQRLAHEHKTKLARLEQIFVTRNTWPAIGGFPGLALTVQDAGVKELSLHGPPFLENILISMKRFVVLKNLQLKTVDCTQIQDFEDEVMSVKAVPLFCISEDSKGEQNLNADAKEQVTIAYICKLKPRPGALNLEKCVEHGVPPGPLLGLLKNGIDVTLDDGTLVKSEDVSEPNENPMSLMFLDLPSADFLVNLQKHEDILVNSKINGDNTPEMPLVVHFSPPETVNNSLYQNFLAKFPTTTQHIFLNLKQDTFSGYVAAHRIQYQLNLLNPNIFPLLTEASSLTSNLNNKLKKTKLDDDHVNGSQESELNASSNNSEESNFVTNLNPMTYFHLRPRKGLDRSSEAKLSPSEYIEETHSLLDFPVLLEKLKTELRERSSSDSSRDYPVITFLGTGSCIPNKTRNVSSILIQPQKDSFVLLDCGEGSLGQIKRFFGCEQADHVIRNLKCIYVSHLHADHHMGLIGLLTERLQLLGNGEGIEKVLLLAPKQIEPWLKFYDKHIFNIENSYQLKSNADMLAESLKLSDSDFGIESIKTCLVKHCAHSFGVRLKLSQTNKQNKPIKITYSGDTMPCQDLIDLGLNSDVLIHEATMEDDLVEEAKIKTHSTISQAIKQGQLMNAQHTILTHFSQRYAKLPRLQLNTIVDSPCSSSNTSLAELEPSLTKDSQIMKNVSIAFDNMQVSLHDLEHFHLMYPAMYSLFAEHAEELEQKALKRELKLERKRKLLSP